MQEEKCALCGDAMDEAERNTELMLMRDRNSSLV